MLTWMVTSTAVTMVQVFEAGTYETGQIAGWGEGDWNGDGIFNSSRHGHGVCRWRVREGATTGYSCSAGADFDCVAGHRLDWSGSLPTSPPALNGHCFIFPYVLRGAAKNRPIDDAQTETPGLPLPGDMREGSSITLPDASPGRFCARLRELIQVVHMSRVEPRG